MLTLFASKLFVSPTIGGQTNVLLHQTLFGVPHGSHLVAASGSQLLVFAGLLLLLAAIAYLSTRLPRPPSAPPPFPTKVIPFTTVVFAAFIPLAAGLYLAATTAWTLAQAVAMRRFLR